MHDLCDSRGSMASALVGARPYCVHQEGAIQHRVVQLHSTAGAGRVVKGELLKGHLDLILLAVLDERPAYGYGLIRVLRSRTGGMLSLTEGTIYPVLHRLEQAGFLESQLMTVQARRRRLYQLTPAGRDELQRLRQEWEQFSLGVEKLLSGEGG